MAATGVGAGVGAVRAASAAAGGDWFDGGGAGFSAQGMKNGAKNFEKKAMSTMGQLGKAAVMAATTKNPVTKGYQSAIESLAGANGLLQSKEQKNDGRSTSRGFNIGLSKMNAAEMLDSFKNPQKYDPPPPKDKDKDKMPGNTNKNIVDNQSTTTSADTNESIKADKDKLD